MSDHRRFYLSEQKDSRASWTQGHSPLCRLYFGQGFELIAKPAMVGNYSTPKVSGTNSVAETSSD